VEENNSRGISKLSAIENLLKILLLPTCRASESQLCPRFNTVLWKADQQPLNFWNLIHLW